MQNASYVTGEWGWVKAEDTDWSFITTELTKTMRWCPPSCRKKHLEVHEQKLQDWHLNIKWENLERRYCGTYWQGSNGDADRENRLVDTAGEGQGGANGESCMEIDTLLYVKQITSGDLLYDSGNSNRALGQPRGVGWAGRWEGG